jgi:hypothetical protein
MLLLRGAAAFCIRVVGITVLRHWLGIVVGSRAPGWAGFPRHGNGAGPDGEEVLSVESSRLWAMIIGGRRGPGHGAVRRTRPVGEGCCCCFPIRSASGGRRRLVGGRARRLRSDDMMRIADGGSGSGSAGSTGVLV